MKYNYINKLAANFVDKSKHSRDELKSVLFTEDAAIATNGHILIEIKAPEQPENTKNEVFEDVLVPGHILKNVSPDRAEFRVEDRTFEVNREMSITGYVRYMKEKKLQTTAFELPDKEFPDVARVLKKKKAHNTVYVSPEYLEVIGKTFKQAGANMVQIDSYKDGEPIRITAKAKTGQDIVVVVMPMTP